MQIEVVNPAGVEIEVRRVMTDRYGGVATRYTVQFEDPSVPEFSIVGKGEVTAKARVPWVLIGGERFDNLLRIRSRDQRVHVYLTSQALEASLDLVERFSDVRISNSKIVAHSADLEKDPAVILRTVATLMDLARLLSPQLALAPQT